MSTKLDSLIHAMLLENTGSHFLDSGGAYGRNWQRNQTRTLQDYLDSPAATVEVSKWERDGVTRWDVIPCLSIFHHLRQALDLDSLCDEFNFLDCDDWNGDYYGVSSDQSAWLSGEGFEPEGDGFNSYNWSANFSQVVQGQHLERDGERYVLLQIHGGCDVRGGYTNAKLFKVNCEEGYLLYESAGFGVENAQGEWISLDWHGSEWVNQHGSCASDEDIAQFCEAAGEGVHAGDQFAVC